MKYTFIALALFLNSATFAQTIAAPQSQLPTECIPCPVGTYGASCAAAQSPRCQRLLRNEIQRIVYEAQAKERELVPAECSPAYGNPPIVVPPVIATFDPFAVAISSQLASISEAQVRRCKKAREKFQTWLKNRNAGLDLDWDTRLKARLAADYQPVQPLYPQQYLPQTLAQYCSQYVSPDENAACLYNGIAQLYPQPGQAPAGYIPMPAPAQGQYQEGQ